MLDPAAARALLKCIQDPEPRGSAVTGDEVVGEVLRSYLTLLCAAASSQRQVTLHADGDRRKLLVLARRGLGVWPTIAAIERCVGEAMGNPIDLTPFREAIEGDLAFLNPAQTVRRALAELVGEATHDDSTA